ncbi:hypothetical protein T484DRAFT_1809543 [Baffinella frigidus]|nr:hypothetical protein T484DRAFT_1809543 [Cryptophyta sp. CCMP2293]
MACTVEKYTSFSTLNVGCDLRAPLATCDLRAPPAACLSAWGARTQNLQDAESFHVIALNADDVTLNGYIDGYHASGTPPLSVTATAAAAITQLRLGMVDQGDESNSGFGSVDVAEMMVYDTALTNQEMDRIGNYLSTKFNLKSRGCLQIVRLWRWSTVGCDTSVGPYCAQAAALASGTCGAEDATIKIVVGESYLGLSDTKAAPQVGPAKGGNILKIKGYHLFPSDINVDGASGILGGLTAAATTFTDAIKTEAYLAVGRPATTFTDAIKAEAYLAVSVGHVPYDCRVPSGQVNCDAIDRTENFATSCRIAVMPTGQGGDRG